MANLINIPGINQNVKKMAFTDLITALLGSNNLTPNLLQNVTNFFNTRNPSLSQITNFQSFTQAFQNIQNLLSNIQNPVVQLYLNPQTITVRKKVLLDKKQTRGGFVIQFWGHDLEVIEVKAATAYFQLSTQPLAAFELLKSQVYQSRFSETQPFKGTPIISMIYESQILSGYFENFEYTLSATEPYYATYSFTFIVTQNLTSVLSSALNIAQTAVNIIDVLKTGNLNIKNPTSVTDLVSFSQGWGVTLY